MLAQGLQVGLGLVQGGQRLGLSHKYFVSDRDAEHPFTTGSLSCQLLLALPSAYGGGLHLK